MNILNKWLEDLRIALQHRYGLAPVLTGPFVPRRSPRRAPPRKRSSIRNAKTYEDTQPHHTEEN
jgi:hypothetical protein